MKEEGDLFKKLQNNFSQVEGHLYILENPVPVELQMEYFKCSQKMRSSNNPPRPIPDDSCEKIYEDLVGDSTLTLSQKRNLLVQLATSKSIRAYRLLEDYEKSPSEDVKDWVHMALMDARMSLESDFSEEKQIYISTGLGGKGEKLRFYVLMLSKGKIPFLEYQRQTIEREIAYYLPKENCEVERLYIGEQYVELLFLVPVRSDIKSIIDKVIIECNQYGDFISNTFTITNVKQLNSKEIADILSRNEDN